VEVVGQIFPAVLRTVTRRRCSCVLLRPCTARREFGVASVSCLGVTQCLSAAISLRVHCIPTGYKPHRTTQTASHGSHARPPQRLVHDISSCGFLQNPSLELFVYVLTAEGRCDVTVVKTLNATGVIAKVRGCNADRGVGTAVPCTAT
jgi:hypothetical protein